MLRLLATLSLLAATPAFAQQAAPAPTPITRTSAPLRVLFIGNSFTQGAHSAVRNWHAGTVTDLNRAGYGGVPALFKAFADQAGLNYEVSLETQGGKTLGFHYDERRQLFDRSWDVVVLQELSTLSRARPGDATDYVRDVGRLTRLLTARNPRVRVELMSTWSRADLAYRGQGRWAGKPIATMALDLRAAADQARAATPGVSGVLPVGQAWNRAFARGVADPNPYDGVTFGQADLWTYDQYHASVAGYYLEALIVFGQLTGIDPRTLGRGERSADELGLSQDMAAALQEIASDELRGAR
ncbi:PEP-CTERM sorting domain-containing protein [uncultured Sphingomonas sp.]|uniref:PEP-CTERM sorting domain-containing protein n=1 Tax=uncultured Sphingomonas sp. TaxID=158754 RepID=UPI0025F701F0|nr:PEP-CTERM sorting domain-containing protein [uncultured Sphingomonas sp.]